MEAQSRRMSAVEATANTVIGYGIAVGAQVAIFPIFGINVPLADNFLIGGIFMAISLVRSYVLRRLFNAIQSLL
jgi:hypothetical protein